MRACVFVNGHCFHACVLLDFKYRIVFCTHTNKEGCQGWGGGGEARAERGGVGIEKLLKITEAVSTD